MTTSMLLTMSTVKILLSIDNKSSPFSAVTLLTGSYVACDNHNTILKILLGTNLSWSSSKKGSLKTKLAAAAAALQPFQIDVVSQ